MHKGEIIKKVVDQTGMPIAQIAREMGVARGTVYNIFSRIEVPADTILKIGRIIGYDFSIKFPKLKSANKTEDPEEEYNTKTVSQLKSDVEYWKGKYITLLEEHNKLLKK